MTTTTTTFPNDDYNDSSDDNNNNGISSFPYCHLLFGSGRNVKTKRKVPGMMENEAPMEEDIGKNFHFWFDKARRLSNSNKQ